jgi:hypothetical protein
MTVGAATSTCLNFEGVVSLQRKILAAPGCRSSAGFDPKATSAEGSVHLGNHPASPDLIRLSSR